MHLWAALLAVCAAGAWGASVGGLFSTAPAHIQARQGLPRLRFACLSAPWKNFVYFCLASDVLRAGEGERVRDEQRSILQCVSQRQQRQRCQRRRTGGSCGSRGRELAVRHALKHAGRNPGRRSVPHHAGDSEPACQLPSQFYRSFFLLSACSSLVGSGFDSCLSLDFGFIYLFIFPRSRCRLSTWTSRTT